MDIGTTTQVSTLAPVREMRLPETAPRRPLDANVERGVGPKPSAIYEPPKTPRTTHANEMAVHDANIGNWPAGRFENFIDFEA